MNDINVRPPKDAPKPGERNSDGWFNALVNGVAERLGLYAAPTTSQVHVPGAEDVVRKRAKDEAGYHGATGLRRCGNCRFFQPPDACEVVEGKVEAGSACDRWRSAERSYAPISKAHDGGMIAFYPSNSITPISTGLTHPNSRAVEQKDLHMTLVYLGPEDDLGVDRSILELALKGFAGNESPVVAKAGGLIRFSKEGDDDTQAVCLVVDSPFLPAMRQRLMDVLEIIGLMPDSEHGFVPHMTVAYLHRDEPTPRLDQHRQDLIFDKIALAWGDDVRFFNLVGDQRFYVPVQKDVYGDVLLFPVSTFYRDGKRREFTAEQAAEMARNFKENVLGRTDGKLPVNAEHERWRGRIGYVTDVVVKDGQPFVKLDEAEPGALDKFDYISPEIRWLWTHPYTGQEYRNVLMGVAATNYPFLLGKTAIAKSLVWDGGEWFRAITEVTPAYLKDAPQAELLSMHRRTHQLWGGNFAGNTKETADGLTREDVANAHALIVEEMGRRGVQHDTPIEKARSLDFSKLPAEITVTPQAVSIVGGVARGEDGADVDVLFRFEVDKDDPRYVRLRRENLDLPVRNALKLGKDFHPIDNPQGPHGEALPLYDLVLRRCRRVEKAGPRLKFVGTGAMDSSRRGASLLVEFGGQRVQIDAEKPGDVQDNLDALLVTDPRAWNAKAAVKEGGEVALYEKDGLRIEPHKVRHTTHDVHGYLVRAGGKRIAYAPELWAWPSWADGADIAVVDGSAWGRDVAFAAGAGGHRALDKLAATAREHGVKRVIATHVGKPVERAIEAGEVEGVEIARDGQTLELVGKAAVVPGRRYTVMKPSMAGSTEFFSTDELWDKWAGGKIERGKPLLGSAKIDGFRSVLSWDGDALTAWFEDAKESKRFPAVAKAVRGKRPFVIEGEFTARAGGKWAARTELAGVAAGKTEATPHFWLYDLLYDGGDVSGEPFRERLARLRKLRLPKSHFTVLEQRAVKDKRGLASVGRWAASEPLSEGLFVREADAPYAFGSTDSAAKWKTVFEIKIVILDVVRRQNGYTYRAGLRDGGKFKNNVSYKGQTFVDLGNTFVTKTRMGDVGDTLNVRIEELLLLSDSRLAWGKPTVVGPDKSRPAYTAAQAIDLAKRGRVFKQEVTKADEEGDEAGPRARAAARNWEKNWQDMLPKSGRGRFVYQHHYRGLSEDEAKLGDERLLNLDRDVSVHGDIRLEGGGGLWGWAVFLGEAKDNRDGDKLVTGKQANLQLAPKLAQPKSWLRVGRGAGTVVKPGGPGSTSRKFSKFFVVDEGTYRLGVARVHFVEVFLNGRKLKGRYLFQYAPLGGSRKWIVDKPKDQRPFAETHDRDKVVAELKRKGQRWLFWGDGKGRPELIDVTKAKVEDASEFVHEVTFSRLDDHERVASGIVLLPDVPDAQGHVMRAAEIEAAAHRYAERMRLDLHHDRDVGPDEAWVVESWVQREPATWRFEMDGETRETRVPPGAWCASVRFGERLWDEVLSGEITGFSPKGWGVLSPVDA